MASSINLTRILIATSCLLATLSSAPAQEIDCGCDEDCSLLATTIFSFGGDSWAARLDDDDWNNFGFRATLNQSVPLGYINLQGGAAFGLYDISGHEQGDTQDNEEQAFVTLGAYHRAIGDEILTWGFVWDYLHNENVGEEHNAVINLHQFRWRVGALLNERNEIGIWGAQGIGSAEPFTSTNQGPISVYPAEQYSLYWDHRWDSGAQTMLYFGRLSEPGQFVLGANSLVPISDRVAMYGNFAWGRPSSAAGDLAPNGVEQSYSEAYWNVGVGVSISLRPWRQSETPLMPVADNGTFMVSAPVGAL